jgi:hypothetical protein
MAKIDTSKIEGYAEMTPEQKIAALEAVEYDDKSSELERYKNAASKANSEAAEWKKKHNALLSDEEKKKQAADEELSALRRQVEEMQREKLITGNKAQLLALGYDETLAAETAKAMAEGDNDKVFANQKKFLDSDDKAYKAQLMSERSKPPAGGTGSQNVDYAKLIEDAKARGDFAAEAYYTRVSQQDNKT